MIHQSGLKQCFSNSNTDYAAHLDILLTDVMYHFQTSCSHEEMLEKKLTVLRGILESEEVYLRELDALLTVTLTYAETSKKINSYSFILKCILFSTSWPYLFLLSVKIDSCILKFVTCRLVVHNFKHPQTCSLLLNFPFVVWLHPF